MDEYNSWTSKPPIATSYNNNYEVGNNGVLYDITCSDRFATSNSTYIICVQYT